MSVAGQRLECKSEVTVRFSSEVELSIVIVNNLPKDVPLGYDFLKLIAAKVDFGKGHIESKLRKLEMNISFGF